MSDFVKVVNDHIDAAAALDGILVDDDGNSKYVPLEFIKCLQKYTPGKSVREQKKEIMDYTIAQEKIREYDFEGKN